MSVYSSKLSKKSLPHAPDSKKGGGLATILCLTASVLSSGGKASIDSTGFDKRHSSRHYVKRCRMKLGSMKTMLIVDTGTFAILDVHMTVKKRHDNKTIMSLTMGSVKSSE